MCAKIRELLELISVENEIQNSLTEEQSAIRAGLLMDLSVERTVAEYVAAQRKFGTNNPRPSYYPEAEFDAARAAFLSELDVIEREYAGNPTFTLDSQTQRDLDGRLADIAYLAGQDVADATAVS